MQVFVSSWRSDCSRRLAQIAFFEATIASAAPDVAGVVERSPRSLPCGVQSRFGRIERRLLAGTGSDHDDPGILAEHGSIESVPAVLAALKRNPVDPSGGGTVLSRAQCTSTDCGFRSGHYRSRVGTVVAWLQTLTPGAAELSTAAERAHMRSFRLPLTPSRAPADACRWLAFRMPELRTNSCRRFGHPEFRLRFDTEGAIVSDVHWLLETLEALVASGRRHADGESFQVWWIAFLPPARDCRI